MVSGFVPEPAPTFLMPWVFGLPRKEETEEYAEHAYPHVAVQKSLFERAWDKESEVRGSFDVLWQGALGW